jgi:hypothetical protein
MNKVMHGIVLALFAFECWFVSFILKLPGMVPLAIAHPPPAFTRLCMNVGPIILAAWAVLGAAYCVFVWVRKTERPPSWIAFLAATMSAVVLSLLPTVVAIFLPLVDFLNRMPRT